MVDLTAAIIIAAENRIECEREDQGLILKGPGTKNWFTVLGNIVGGPIIINGAALARRGNHST